MTQQIANAEMAAAWDGPDGEDWARDWERYDRSSRNYHRVLLDAAAISAEERVLDIGCGNGQTTRDAARLASNGSALGIDLSAKMLERARELAQREGLTNVTFTQGDAQTHQFADAVHNVVVSRFGAMFFEDPVAAFRNIGSGVATGGRVAILAWRRLDDNEWLRCIRGALAAGRDLPTPPTGMPGPFGLADADRTTSVLTAAGFEAVELTPADEQLWFGADVEDAFAFFRKSGIFRGLTEGLDEAQQATAIDELRAVIAQHDTGDGVEFGSAAWLITARKR